MYVYAYDKGLVEMVSKRKGEVAHYISKKSWEYPRHKKMLMDCDENKTDPK